MNMNAECGMWNMEYEYEYQIQIQKPNPRPELTVDSDKTAAAAGRVAATGHTNNDLLSTLVQ